jgi:hypothetical protein
MMLYEVTSASVEVGHLPDHTENTSISYKASRHDDYYNECNSKNESSVQLISPQMG